MNKPKQYMNSKIVDQSTNKGVYKGDLAYGRANGNVPVRGRDFTAEPDEDGNARNLPAAPLILVKERDPNVWTKDPMIKQVKRDVGQFQYSINQFINSYRENADHLRANIHVTVGRQRL